MRRFEVWFSKKVVGCEPVREVVEVPDDATDQEVEDLMVENLEVIISNETESGWRELK